MIKVLFAYEYLTHGGVETVILTRLRRLAGYGAEPWAWFLNSGDGAGLFAGMDPQVMLGNQPFTEGLFENGFFDLVCVFDSPRILSRLENTHAKVVVECHSPYNENLEYLRSLRSNQVLGILVPSQYQHRMVASRLVEPIPVEVIPNALSPRFLPEPQPFHPRPPRPIIAWIGRLDSLKNWTGLLRIASKLVDKGVNAEVWVIGGFPGDIEGNPLFRQAKATSLLGRLRWFQRFPHEHMPRLLDAVRASGGLVLSTSLGESFGMAVAEAMARGVAVVVPDLPPFGEFIVHEESGVIVDIQDEQEVVGVLSRLVSDAATRDRLGTSARRAVLGRYSVDNALPPLVSILHRFLDRQPVKGAMARK